MPGIRVLVHVGPAGHRDHAAALAPVLRHLESVEGVELTLAPGSPDPAGHDVVLAISDSHLDDATAVRLVEHVRGGGGLVLLHGTLAAWSRNPALAEAAGWAPFEALPETELRLNLVPGPVTHRLDGELLVVDSLELGDPPPPSWELIATAHWHFERRPLALSRRVGGGTLVHCGLGGPAAMADATVQRLVHRLVRLAAGLDPAPVLGVGLLGYGAIGREHAQAVNTVEGLELRAVADSLPARREAAAREFGVSPHEGAAGLLADPGVDVVVVGVPPVAHAGAVLEVLAAGRHAVCEKPFALRTEEADRMLAAATAAGRALTVYQSRRWDPDFVALRRQVEAGAIGDLFYMESFIGGYEHPCQHWHSHEPVSGGMIYDWGSHYFDWLLLLFGGRVASVSAVAHKRVWHDVTNADQVRVDLTFADGRQAGFLQSDVAAALKPKWYLLGTRGAITGDWRLESVRERAWTGDLVEHALRPAESPARLTVHRPDGEGGIHREQLALPPRERHGFYRNLADHLLLGEPLAVPAAQARRNVAVMEAAARSIAQGRPVEVDD